MTPTLEQWIEERVGKEIPQPGLERLQRAWQGFDFPKPLVVTIAGTNGKGEVAMRLAAFCQHFGIRYTLWTSPHLVSVCERFESSEGKIDENQLKKHLIEVRARACELSYYEWLYLAFLEWSQILRPELIIQEVGLGGRLDAVNLLDADLVGITSIGRDHEQYLGSELSGIFKEKWAVSRPGKLTLTNLEQSELRELAKGWSSEQQVVWRDIFAEHEPFYRRNQLLASELAQALVNSLRRSWDESAKDALEWALKKPLLGRAQTMTGPYGCFIFIGSHNLCGLEALITACEQGRPPWKTKARLDLVLAGFSQRPDWEAAAIKERLRTTKVFGEKIRLVSFDHPRAMQMDTHWKDELAKYANSQQTILILGSYYFLGEVLSSTNLHFLTSAERPLFCQ